MTTPMVTSRILRMFKPAMRKNDVSVVNDMVNMKMTIDETIKDKDKGHTKRMNDSLRSLSFCFSFCIHLLQVFVHESR